MFELLPLAFFLGIKHSFDSDHLIAVSNFLSNSKSLNDSIKMSASWAIGHIVTATTVTVLLLIFKDSILSMFLKNFESFVGIMLIFFGIIGLHNAIFFKSHKHVHEHNGKKHVHFHLHKKGEAKHSHIHLFGIGIIQGIASNDELLLLLTVSLGLATFFDIAIGIGVFSIGVVFGMIAFSTIFTIPILKNKSEKLSQFINAFTGSISVIFGITLILPFL